MNNGTYCYPGGGGHGRARYSGDPDQFEKMDEGSMNNVNTHPMTGPGFGPTSGPNYRSQFPSSDFNTVEDDGCGSTSRPSSNYINPDYPLNSQYQGHAHHYPQHARYYPGTSKVPQPLHPVYSAMVGGQGGNYGGQRMHSGPGSTFPGQHMGQTPTLNNLLQSPSTTPKTPPLAANSASNRDETIPTSLQSKSELNSPTHSPYSMHQQQQQPPASWAANSRVGAHPYMYPQQGPGSSLYRSQQSGGSDMSQGRRPAVGGSYPQQGGQYMSQQMAMGPGPGSQRFMMGGQIPNQMYGHAPPQPQMYMPPSQQPPGPPLSPASRPLTPQQSQLQQIQIMVQNSPKQPSPAPSDHGSVYSMKQEENSQDMKSELGNPEDISGENSRGSTGVPRPAPSPVGSSGSRSNTPASIPGAQAGSPMPLRPPSGQVDGQNRMTQSPMATQGMDTGYNQQMMPPPNSMGYMPGPGKMGSGQLPVHFPQYNSQYPQGTYNRQPVMGMGGPPMGGPMQSYPGSQQGMYPNGPGQMQGPPIYGNMPGMNRNMSQQGYVPSPYSQSNANMSGMPNSQYPGYSMGPMPGQHGMPQPTGPGSMPPGSTSGPMGPNIGGQPGLGMPQQHSSSSNKAAQAAQAAMMAAANSVGPRMSHSRGSMSPSRGMFGQSGGPLAQMNNMTNSPNLGSPSLNSMSNAVEQLARNSGLPSSLGGISTSTSSPVPKSSHSPAVMPNNTSSSIAHGGDHNQTSPLSNADTFESSSRPNSNTAHHPDLPTESTTCSDSLGGMPSDSTSVDSGFHSSDQSDKTSDSVSTPTLSGVSPPPSSSHQNGDTSRTLENISPPGHMASHLSHHQHMQHPHHHMVPEPKMPYSDGGIPLPPSSMSSAMSLMPSSSSSVVTTASTGPMLTSVTQSIMSPVTSVSTSMPHHPHPHMMVQPGGPPPHLMGHGMGLGPHGMMSNGMPPSNMMNPGHIGGQMGPNMVGSHNMMPPNMVGANMNMNQNGPMMGPNGPMMSHNGPMMSGHPGMNAGGNNVNMPMMNQMPPHQQMNCMPAMGNNNNNVNAGTNTLSDEPPEKKKKVKEAEGQPRAGSAGPHYTEEPNSPGALKSSSDLTKLYELGPEPDRRMFLERVLSFLEESGQPVTALPVISKTPLDLYKLYFCVKEKGGFEEVTRSKKWRDICTVVNIGTSASAAFTLKKNYIRYLFNYECKYDRGGINPAPILAQMEAQLAHKREQKTKRAPSPGSNSNDSFHNTNVPNNQMESSYPPNMPPPYMQNPDGNMPNSHMSGSNMMMGANNMMGGPQHSGMMCGPQMGPSGMMGGPGPGMMHGQQGMIPPNSSGGNMLGSQIMSGGPPGYGGPMMQQSGPIPPTSNSGGPQLPPPHNVSGPMPVTSDSVSVQDPFSDDSGYMQRGMPPQMTPPPQSLPASPMSSSYPGMQQSTMGNTTNTSTAGRPVTSSSGYGGPDQQMGLGYPPNSAQPNAPPPPPPSSVGQFGFGQTFERPDRFDQSSPNMQRPPGPTPGMAPSQQPPQQPGESSAPMYPGSRFPGPPPPQAIGMRPSQPGDAQFPQQGPPYQSQAGYPGPQYSGYPQTQGGPYPGPRPPPGPSNIYGTPSKRFPDESGPNQYTDWTNPNIGNHMSYGSGPLERQAPSPDVRDGAPWSPMQRSRGPQTGPGYMPPAPPSTPPMGAYGRQMGHRNSPQTREVQSRSFPGQQKMPPVYAGMPVPPVTKKELVFPSDCVEGINISTIKRKKLTHKDLAPFEAWRLMLALKSGLLAESTWALDTLNILLYDDVTYGYFSLNTLPGLLEVLTEHFRHCLMQIFEEFQDLEVGQSRKYSIESQKLKLSSEIKSEENEADKKEDLKLLRLSGANFTMMSRKGLPVKIDPNPSDTSVLESKDWDLYSNFISKPDHWITGGGDITDHILTHLESHKSNGFLSGKFRRKRARNEDVLDNEESHGNHDAAALGVDEKKAKNGDGKSCEVSNERAAVNERSNSSETTDTKLEELLSVGANDKTVSDSSNLECNKAVLELSESCSSEENPTQPPEADQKKPEEVPEDANHFKMCNGETSCQKKTTETDPVEVKVEPVENLECVETKENQATLTVDAKGGDAKENGESVKKDSPSNPDVVSSSESSNLEKPDDKEIDNCSNSSPPVLTAECINGEEDMAVDGAPEPMTSTVNTSTNSESMEVDSSAVVDVSSTPEIKEEVKSSECTIKEERIEEETVQADNNKKVAVVESSQFVVESYVSETEELSASIVAEMLKEDEHVEDEAFLRDDPPLCVTPESRDELGRRCVCISNIIRSLSCVPGNEARICKHPGIMRVLGRLLLLHHSHPERPPPRKLPSGDEEEEEREEPPRVYDDEHWWWDYLDQLRENTLVILANICGHLMLDNFSEQVCFPLLEGLLHWVICPASVARDPLPTLTPGSVLSPQRLVLEALCKLCIHETNVDLLLATPPVKRILELFNVLVKLLADRNHQITREFSIVLLSLLVPGETSAARAVALQHPCVSLLVDFLETAEQNALAIANQQGLEVLQSNPEVMGTSLDMLRRAALILLHMARVPDNRKMFVQQQSRLLNLVMSQILDQSVSNTLSEVLFECSQFS